MSNKSFLINLPFVEYWLIPAIFIFLVGVLSLIDSPPLCSATCSCIEQTP